MKSLINTQTWWPDTCSCKVDIIKKKLITQCKLHTTYQQTLEHNQSFNYSNKSIKQKHIEKERIKNL